MKYVRSLILTPLTVLASAVLIFSTVSAYKTVDPLIFPALELEVDSVKATNTGFEFNGVVDKLRDCDILEVTAYLSNSKVYNKPYKVIFDNNLFMTGPAIDDQKFDKWTIETEAVIPTNVSIYAKYQCNDLWYSVMKLDEFTIDYSNSKLDIHRYNEASGSKNFLSFLDKLF